MAEDRTQMKGERRGLVLDRYGGAAWGGNAGTTETPESGIKGLRPSGDAGTTGADLDVERYRGLGQAAQGRPGVQIDYKDADRAASLFDRERANSFDARARQSRGVSMLGEAARGEAPSAAAINAQANTGRNLSAMLQGNAAGIGANRRVMGGYRDAATQNAAQTAGARAVEMDAAQRGYGMAAGQMRAGDYASAGASTRMGSLQGDMSAAQANQDFRQRELNQGYQQQMENYAYGVRSAADEAELRNREREIGITGFDNQMKQAEVERLRSYIGAGTSAAGGALAAYSAYGGGGGGGGGGGARGGGATAPAYNPYAGNMQGGAYSTGEGSYYSDDDAKMPVRYFDRKGG